MRRCPAVAHQRLAVRPADKAIEQTISMNVAAFLSPKKEPDSAKAMNSRPYVRQLAYGFFDIADGAQTRRMKNRG